LRSIASALILVPVLLVLLHCGQAGAPSALTANARAVAAQPQAAPSANFDDRFPVPLFTDRFSGADESLSQRQMADLASHATTGSDLASNATTGSGFASNATTASDFAPRETTAPSPEPASYRLASLEPPGPYSRPTAHRDLTTLVSMKSSAFPYYGDNPGSDTSFLNVSKDGRRGHRSYSGRVYWQDETYSDSRVLVHIPETFDLRKPAAIVVFFHGNGATLERDVRDRQLVPQQVSESGANVVLLAPQMAVDAADSSAGKFWQPGAFRRFIMESAVHLARQYGDPGAAKAFADLPIVIVGYSGGFLPTAWSLEVGGLSNHVRGVILLDAVYGELDKFASWIETHRSGFFVSSYTHYTARHDHDLMNMLREKGIAVSEDMDAPLHPGSVVFVETGEGITHRDYVTNAWTKYPIEQVLMKMAAAPALKVRISASARQ